MERNILYILIFIHSFIIIIIIIVIIIIIIIIIIIKHSVSHFVTSVSSKLFPTSPPIPHPHPPRQAIKLNWN
jgi:hypothetical protein